MPPIPLSKLVSGLATLLAILASLTTGHGTHVPPAEPAKPEGAVAHETAAPPSLDPSAPAPAPGLPLPNNAAPNAQDAAPAPAAPPADAAPNLPLVDAGAPVPPAAPAPAPASAAAPIPGAPAAAAPAAAPAPAAPAAPATVKEPTIQEAIIDATNRFRAENGLPPLKPLPELNKVAQDWSDIQMNQDRMYHNPDFGQQYPKGWRRALENVLQNWNTADAEALVAQWANSPGHRANMLNPDITHIGVGVADTAKGKRYATQNFAAY
ncbi:CAP domain-containing protein [Corynebacterium glaucum]|uniref:CAP domain-containing protein n=1 Tax=Corynebacterium glaucum TaxID=187491 RepID=UPI0025B60B20|nr:CAP domain-containing protein [Corynebacterium glaucum]WJZ07006.1 Cysteine-rich secretory protein family protein [Corynebacterium glaucum]